MTEIIEWDPDEAPSHVIEWDTGETPPRIIGGYAPGVPAGALAVPLLAAAGVIIAAAGVALGVYLWRRDWTRAAVCTAIAAAGVVAVRAVTR